MEGKPPERARKAMLFHGTDLSGLTTTCDLCAWRSQKHPGPAWEDLTLHFVREHPAAPRPAKPDDYRVLRWRFDQAVDQMLSAEGTAEWARTVDPYVRANESLLGYVKKNNLEGTDRDPLAVQKRAADEDGPAWWSDRINRPD